MPLPSTFTTGSTNRGATVLAVSALALLVLSAADLMRVEGFAWLALLFGTAAWAGHPHARWRAVAWVLFIPTALALGAGLAPGFEALVLFEPSVIKEGSAPYGLHVRMGKALVGLALLLWLVPLASGFAELKRAALRALPVAAGTMVIVYSLALFSGYVRFVPGFPPPGFTLAWMAVNLFVVCVVEEGFFRGVVQARLASYLPVHLAILVAAVLFGLVHAGGGWVYVLLATVAGAGYGIAYQRAGHIEAPVLAHFLLNLGHLGLFTYPVAL